MSVLEFFVLLCAQAKDISIFADFRTLLLGAKEMSGLDY